MTIIFWLLIPNLLFFLYSDDIFEYLEKRIFCYASFNIIKVKIKLFIFLNSISYSNEINL